MANMAMLIDYEWCTGCHSCELACSMEHGHPEGQCGLVVSTIGPWETTKDVWEFTNYVFPTHLCNTCTDRRAQGKAPTCVHHCQAKCLQVGTLEDMEALLAQKPDQALFRLS